MNAISIESAFRFCPRCGLEKSESNQVPFRCDGCGFTNFFGPVAAVGGLITNDANELLLVCRARNPRKGKWGLPGGFVDREESIEQALAREVNEEVGLRVLQHEYLISFPNLYEYGGVVASVIDLFYLCHADLSVPIQLAFDELDDYAWVSPDDPRLNEMAFPSNRKAIEFWQQRD